MKTNHQLLCQLYSILSQKLKLKMIVFRSSWNTLIATMTVFYHLKSTKVKLFPLNLFSMLGLTLPISLLKEFTNTFEFLWDADDKFEIMLISSRTVYFHVGKTADTGNADEHSAKESFKRLDKDSDGKLNKVCIAYKGYFNFELFRKPTNSWLRIFGLVKICSSLLKSFSGGLY